MKHISFDLKSITAKFKNNSALVFYLVLFIVFVLEISILFGAVRQVIASRRAPEDLPSQKGVRFNFAEYEAATKRIQAGKEYYPESPLFENPFKTSPR